MKTTSSYSYTRTKNIQIGGTKVKQKEYRQKDTNTSANNHMYRRRQGRETLG